MESTAPDPLELAWGVTPPVRAGRRPGLAIGQIVEAAIAIADESSLAACSMPALARRLDVGTMSLYRYVAAKDDLLLLMRDAATGPVPADAPRGAPWRSALAYYTERTTERFARRPWLLDVEVRGFPQTPHLLSWLELGLQSLADAGLDDQQQLGSMLLLDGHVTATARLARAGAAAEPSASEPPVELMDPDAYPALTRLISAGALRDDAFGDYGLRFGLERVLAGIEQLVPPDRPTASR